MFVLEPFSIACYELLIVTQPKKGNYYPMQSSEFFLGMRFLCCTVSFNYKKYTVTNIAHCRLYLRIKITLFSREKHLLVILRIQSYLKGKCRVNIQVDVRYVSLSVSDPQSYRQCVIKVYVVCMDVYMTCRKRTNPNVGSDFLVVSF